MRRRASVMQRRRGGAGSGHVPPPAEQVVQAKRPRDGPFGAACGFRAFE